MAARGRPGSRFYLGDTCRPRVSPPPFGGTDLFFRFRAQRRCVYEDIHFDVPVSDSMFAHPPR